MLRAIAFTFIGFLLGTGAAYKKHSEHTDVIRRLALNMTEDAYYTGCRNAGGQPSFCHQATESYVSPMRDWEW